MYKRLVVDRASERPQKSSQSSKLCAAIAPKLGEMIRAGADRARSTRSATWPLMRLNALRRGHKRMAYDWYDDIDRLGWLFEDEVRQATSDRPESLGMAPSAGDELRATLKQVAAVPPLQLVSEAETTNRAEVDAMLTAIAIAAVEAAVARVSRHITREDVQTAVRKVGGYPVLRS